MPARRPTRSLVRHGDRTAWLEIADDDPPQVILTKTIDALRAAGMTRAEIAELLERQAARLGRRH